ncbi:MAG: biotin/lipoyl-containing protein [Anaerolineales bacterium]
MKFNYRYQQNLVSVELLAGRSEHQAIVAGRNYSVRSLNSNDGSIIFEIDGRKVAALVAKDGRKLWIHLDGKSYSLERVSRQSQSDSLTESERVLRAPMPGQVRQVLVKQGQEVKTGEVLVLLEAMKMEMRIQSPHAAKVARVSVSEGQNVEKEQILVELEGED